MYASSRPVLFIKTENIIAQLSRMMLGFYPGSLSVCITQIVNQPLTLSRIKKGISRKAIIQNSNINPNKAISADIILRPGIIQTSQVLNSEVAIAVVVYFSSVTPGVQIKQGETTYFHTSLNMEATNQL